MKSEFTPKRIAVLLCALVVLFIPTYIAIISYKTGHKTDQVFSDETTYLVIRDPDQKSYTVRRDTDVTRWSVFESMIRNGIAVNEIPESVNKDDNMVLCNYITEKKVIRDGVTESSETVESLYAFYFSDNKSRCYFMDPNKRIFRVADSDAANFLADAELSKFLYRNAELPTLTVLGAAVSPDSADWFYKAGSKTYQNLKLEGGELTAYPYASGEDFGLSFPTAPDSCTVRISAPDGSVLYDASYKNIAPLTLESNTRLTFEATAVWNQTDGCPYYGTVVYRFWADLQAPAKFFISKNTMCLGDFTVISARNVTDASSLVFRSEPSLPETPVFYPCETGMLALVPVSYGCSTGTYMFSVSCGSVSEVFEVKVNDYKYGYKSSVYEVGSALVASNYTEAQVDTNKKLVSEICASASGAPLFDGKFLDYQAKNVLEAKGATLVLGFGRNVKVKDTTKMFEHTGVDFSVTSATPIDVPSMNTGKVLRVGNDAVLGNYVVVDHGCGLRSWYAHLTEITVKAGDSVITGQALGKTAKKGCTGFTPDGRVHIGITVGGQPVAPYTLWESGVVLPAAQ